MSYMSNQNLFLSNRDFIVVDKAINLENKAIINQCQTNMVIAVLCCLKIIYKSFLQAEHLYLLIFLPVFGVVFIT